MGTAYTYRFLIADDDTINRHLMRTILRKFSHEVDVVTNGEEALLAVAEKDYDVVFMDVHMPVMDGIEAMLAMRTALPEDRLPAVVALSGSSDDATLKRCLEAGMTDYLLKPADMGTIRLWLTAWENSHAASVNPSEELLNMTRIRELKELEGSASTEAVVAELLAMFRNECPIQIAELRDALANGDVERVAFLSHKLKGSLLNVGLLAAADVCGEMEQLSDGRDADEFLPLIDRLEDLYHRSYSEFSQYLRSA